jgi:hypothetical protein
VKAWYFIQKFDEKISSLKKDNFSQEHKKINSICTQISFETMVLSIGFVKLY